MLLSEAFAAIAEAAGATRGSTTLQEKSHFCAEKPLRLSLFVAGSFADLLKNKPKVHLGLGK